jgi:outer membrane receptor for ferrienterochelin and colicin
MCISLIAFSFVYAAETGRIAGRVIDSETKAPLIGVSVVVEGTQLGASTDENGRYLISNVSAGSQTVTASYVGYDATRVKDLLVILDQTITLNFNLRSTVIQVGTVEVTAERQLLVRTQASTQRVITTDQFDKLPIGTLGAIVALTPGLVTNTTVGSSGAHLRGGRPEEITYFVDGISTSDPTFGYSAARVNPQATAEVLVISGGYDAEYGEAMSGIVQIVTKEGRENIAGRIKHTTDAFMPKTLNFGYNQTEISIGGPTPLDKLRYFLSGEVFLADDYSPHKFKLPHQNRQDYKVTGKFTYTPPFASGLKVTADGFIDRDQWELYPYDPTNENQLGFKYWLDHFFSRQERVRKGGLTANHMLTQSTFYTLRYGYFWDERVTAVRDLDKENELGYKFGWRFWEDYQFKALDSVRARPDVINNLMPYYKEQRNDVINNPYGVLQLYYGEGDYRFFQLHGSTIHTFKGDLTHNIGKIHELKTGLEVKKNYLYRRYNSLPSNPNPFVDSYDFYPLNIAAYVQDRMDFEDLVVRTGLRFDYLDPNAYKRANPTNISDTSKIKALNKYKLSPRIAISFPIGEKAKFRFSYGHFFQTPAYQYLYQNISTAAYNRGNQIIGNPDLLAQQTIAYELGVEVLLSQIFAFDFTAYYKDVYDLIGTGVINAVPTGYFPIQNQAYGNVRGIEATFTKQLSNYWSSHFSYGISFAKGTVSYATEWYYERYYYGTDPITGVPMEPPIKDYALDYDERSTAKFDIGCDFPSDFTFAPIRDLAATLLFNYGSGLPYSPRELKGGLDAGNRIGEKNSARMPARFTTDGKISKGFVIAHKLKFNVVCDITNLFNTITTEFVWGYSGKGDDDGYAATLIPAIWTSSSYITIMASTYHPARDLNSDGVINDVEEYISYKAAYKDFVNDPQNFGAPRQIRFGIDFEF